MTTTLESLPMSVLQQVEEPTVLYEPYTYQPGDAETRLAALIAITQQNPMLELTEEKLRDGINVYVARVKHMGEWVVAGVCGSFLQYNDDTVREIGGVTVLPEYRHGSYHDEHIGTTLAWLATESALHEGKTALAFCNTASLNTFIRIGYSEAPLHEVPQAALAECAGCKNCDFDKLKQPCADTIMIKNP